MPHAVKTSWFSKADTAKADHLKANPGYRYQPRAKQPQTAGSAVLDETRPAALGLEASKSPQSHLARGSVSPPETPGTAADTRAGARYTAAIAGVRPTGVSPPLPPSTLGLASSGYGYGSGYGYLSESGSAPEDATDGSASG